jgi:serine O-acetyltransferase
VTEAVPDVMKGISASVPDWSRERPRRFWDPSRRLLGAIRRYQGAGDTLSGRLLRKIAVLEHRFWSVVTGADVPLTSRIGGGLLPHPNGVVIHPSAVIGPNCLLFQQVTLGAGRGGLPVLGGHVDVGAGAKILGPVRVGDHVVIGANAVVTRDVPSCGVAAGIPARLLRIDREWGADAPAPEPIAPEVQA